MTKRVLVLLVWMAVIYWFSDQPNSNQVTENYFGDFNFSVRKLAHFSEYAILFLIANWTLMASKIDRVRCKSAWLAVALAIGYALLDEWHQAYVPGRSAALGDVLIDASGAAVACILIKLWEKRSISDRA
jgi:VanZ family protein